MPRPGDTEQNDNEKGGGDEAARGSAGTSGSKGEGQAKLKPIDDFFVIFLLAYQTNPECDAEFRSILAGPLLERIPDRLDRLAKAFQSPSMEKFIKGGLKARLSQYDLSLPPRHIEHLGPGFNPGTESQPREKKTDSSPAADSLSLLKVRDDKAPVESKEIDLRALISRRSAPPDRSKATVTQAAKPKATEPKAAEPEAAEEPSSPVDQTSREPAEDTTMDDDKRRKGYIPGSRPSASLREIQKRVYDSDEVMTDKEALDLYHELSLDDPLGDEEDMLDEPPGPSLPYFREAIRKPPGPGRPPKEVVDDDESDRAVAALKREGREWRNDSKYKGSRQPPLGVRLEHVLNFLREEDADRCLNWESKLQEISEYLRWLSKDDPDRQLEACGLEVQNMYRDAIDKVRVHEQFQKFHYTPTRLEFQKTTLPRPSGRLDWMGCKRDHPMRFTSKAPDEELRFRSVITRRIKPTNVMIPIGSKEGEEFRSSFRESQEKFLWGEVNEVNREDNLFLMENDTYEDIATKQVGWVVKDPSTGEKTLPDGTPLLPNDYFSLAKERGARRAGLQQALRSFNAVEHKMLMTPWRRVHLPLEAAELDEVRHEIGKNLHWKPFRLGGGEMPFQLETAPYTYWWHEFCKKREELWERARPSADVLQGGLRAWANVPPSGSYGGAFVWRMVDPDVEVAQDQLRECEKAAKMLAAARQRSGERRDLMVFVNAAWSNAANGSYGLDGSSPPPYIQLDPSDWENEKPGTRVKAILPEELEMLMFLSGKQINPQMLVPLQEKGKLFNIFARRVEKVMEDRSPDAPFPHEDSILTVEELLEVLNRGCDGPVRRTRFSVTDAMCWLPRLDTQGRVLFREHLECYGTLMASYQGTYPEHRFSDISQWNPNLWRPLTVNIGTYKEHPTPRLREDPTQIRVRQYFFNLAFRLGVTMFRLRTEKRETWAKLAPASTSSLFDTIAKWKAEYKEAAKVWGLPALRDVVRNANAADFREGMTDDEALRLIRSRIVAESAANATMLGRGRRRTYVVRRGDVVTPDVLAEVWARDHNWDWASARVRGQRPRFFALDRWPVSFQAEATARRIRGEEGGALDPLMVWDPVAEESTAGTFVRPKLRRYGQREKVRFRPGPAIYPIGDTPLQQRVIQERITNMVAEAIGIDRQRPRTWAERLSGILPFHRSSSPATGGDPPLPKIDPSLMPVSWDPQSLLEARQVEGGAEDVDGDVEMAGA